MTTPLVVYKYLAPERIDVLRTRRIRYTQPGALNDPFELKPTFTAVVPEQELRNTVDPTRLALTPYLRAEYQKLSRRQRLALPYKEFQKRTQLLLQSPQGQRMALESSEEVMRLSHALTPVVRAKLANLASARIGILSTSAVADCAPMWAHYAAHHRGFILAFDAIHPYFDRRRSPTDEFFHLRQVLYRTVSGGRALTDLDGTDLLCAKQPTWEYEAEWRILAPLDTADAEVESCGDRVFLFDWPPECLRAVVLGAAAATQFAVEVETLLGEDRFRHVSLTRATIDPEAGRIAIPGWSAAG